MRVSLPVMDPKPRASAVAGWMLLMVSPFLLLGALSAVVGYNALLANPVWTDELDYWRAVFSWLHMGGGVGYSGIGEHAALLGTLSVHGLSPLLLYGWFAALFGWSFSSIVLVNCLWVAAGALTFSLLNRPRGAVAAWMAVAMAAYAPMVLYAATSMTELANYGLLLFYLAFLLKLDGARHKARNAQGVAPGAVGLGWVILCGLTVILCCAYRITYLGLFIPLLAVACDYRWSGRLLVGALAALLLSAFVYYLTALTASPFTSGFLYNFLRAGSPELALRMFLSHAKANLLDYFVRPTSNLMETLQRWLYTGVMILTLAGAFVRAEKGERGYRVRFRPDGLFLMSFVMLFLPFAIVVSAYETNDWSDYRTLAPFLWLVVAGQLIRGRKLVPAAFLAGCAAILLALSTGAPVGAFSDAERFQAQPFSADTQALCAAIEYDAQADTPFDNTVRTDLFTLETVATLHPGIGIETGWFTEDTVGKSRWVLTDHLKIPLEGYGLVLRNRSGSVYRRLDADEKP